MLILPAIHEIRLGSVEAMTDSWYMSPTVHASLTAAFDLHQYSSWN
jgi:hypothetical protein